MNYIKKPIAQLQLGEKVIWMHDSQATEATIVMIAGGRVQITMQNDEGQAELYWVMPENLRVRQESV